MGLIKKNKKKKALTIRGGAGAEQSPYRPQAVEKFPPCIKACPSGNDIRGWLTIIAQREKIGLSIEEACDQAWMIEMETNPMPSIMGRVCPHPCEGECNRKEKDGAVAINSVERYFGDHAIKRGLKAPTLDEAPVRGEGRRGRLRSLRPVLRLPDGPARIQGDHVREPAQARRHVALRHPRIPAAPRHHRRRVPARVRPGRGLQAQHDHRQGNHLRGPDQGLRRGVRRASAPTRAASWAAPARTAPASTPAPSSCARPTPATVPTWAATWS